MALLYALLIIIFGIERETSKIIMGASLLVTAYVSYFTQPVNPLFLFEYLFGFIPAQNHVQPSKKKKEA